MPSPAPLRRKFGAVVLLTLVCLAILDDDGSDLPADALALRDAQLAPAPDEVNGLSRLTKIEGADMLVQTEDGDLSFLPGVNLAASLPGSDLGEPGITSQQYRQWFPEMVATGFRVVRVDGLRQPEFYQELVAYNQANPQDPLYLMHGVALSKEALNGAEDLLQPSVGEAFMNEVDDAVAAANGAGVGYTADAGPWIVGWIVGSELDPHLAKQTNDNNSGVSFQGDHFETSAEAAATEVFLAEAMDRAAKRQAQHGHMVPVAFVNAAATDPIEHHYEPVEDQDLVQIDANAIVAADGWEGGTFASYHAFPFRPAFQRFEPGIADYVHNGQVDPYAGYLRQLRQHHSAIPVVISRFGVPSGHARAHSGPIGRNQGGLDEVTQMAVNSAMMQTIADHGLSGGLLTSWIDDWQRTGWNTAHLDFPARRRSMWMNAWAAEAHFGVMAAEPGNNAPVVVDGADDEWANNGSALIYEGDGPVRQIRAIHDEGWLYLSVHVDHKGRLPEGPMSIGFDVIGGSAGELPSGEREQVADYALTVSEGEAVLMAAGHADAYRRLQDKPKLPTLTGELGTESLEAGAAVGSIAAIEDPSDRALLGEPVARAVDKPDAGPIAEDELVDGDRDSVGDADLDFVERDSSTPSVEQGSALIGNGPGNSGGPDTYDPNTNVTEPEEDGWQPQTLLVSPPFTHPISRDVVPAEVTVPGELVRGTVDRDDPLFDSRATWQIAGTHFEVRIPWQGIGFSDPSAHRAHMVVDNSFDDTRVVVTSNVDRILISAALGDRLVGAGSYTWEPWDEVSWHQVPKNGLELVTQTAERTLTHGLRPSSADVPVEAE